MSTKQEPDAIDPALACFNLVVGQEHGRVDQYRFRNNGWGTPWQAVWHKLHFAAELKELKAPVDRVGRILFEPEALALLQRKCLNLFWLWEVLYQAEIASLPARAVPVALAIERIRAKYKSRHGCGFDLNAIARDLDGRKAGATPGPGSLSPEKITYLYQHGFILRTHPDTTGKVILNPIFVADE